jgi:hypothetical protein
MTARHKSGEANEIEKGAGSQAQTIGKNPRGEQWLPPTAQRFLAQ